MGPYISRCHKRWSSWLSNFQRTIQNHRSWYWDIDLAIDFKAEIGINLLLNLGEWYHWCVNKWWPWEFERWTWRLRVQWRHFYYSDNRIDFPFMHITWPYKCYRRHWMYPISWWYVDGRLLSGALSIVLLVSLMTR